MNQRQQILEFVKRLDDLPVRSEDLLKEFTSDLKFAIQEIFGPNSQYLDYLKHVKFRPEAVFVTDRELGRCWYSGIAQVSNLLKVMLHDPLVKVDPSTEPVSSQDGIVNAPQYDISLEAEADIQDSLEKFKQSMGGSSLIVPQEEGPIQEPLRRDSLNGSDVPSGDVPAGDIRSSSRILLVPGSDQLVNNEVLAFLRSLAVDVSLSSSFEDHGPFVDRLNRYADTDFAVVVLSPDFFFYPRTQAPENVNVMASQEMVFQLGYLVAKLGRQKVIVLVHDQERFRRPTDYFDLYYVSLNPTGAWKADIAKRMKSSGVPIHEGQPIR